jgi:hypothetical protein
MSWWSMRSLLESFLSLRRPKVNSAKETDIMKSGDVGRIRAGVVS